jgi:hypothetical protein
MSITRNAKQIQAKSRKHEVAQTGPTSFTVTSGTSGSQYQITLNGIAKCSCDWGKFRKAGTTCGCSHVLSVYSFLGDQAGRKVMAWSSEEEARRQHRQMVTEIEGLVLTARK